jgi:uncharacterized membrane protein
MDRSASPERLAHLPLSDAERRAALDHALGPPPLDAWRRFLDRALLLAGAGLLAAGIIYFFAFNWAALGRFGQLGLVAGALCAAALLAMRLGVERPGGRAALGVAIVLVGPLFGVYGQVYQTGADAWNLFAAWAALTLPWVVAGRSTALAVLWVAIADVALWLMSVQWLAPDSDAVLTHGLAPALLHGAAWWWTERRGPAWAATVMAAASFAWYGFAGAWLVTAGMASTEVVGGWLVQLLTLALFVAAVLFAAARHRASPALARATCAWLAILVTVDFALARLFFDAMDLEASGVFLLGGIIIGECAWLGSWLRDQSARISGVAR